MDKKPTFVYTVQKNLLQQWWPLHNQEQQKSILHPLFLGIGPRTKLIFHHLRVLHPKP
jgi:hypothetical protein